MGPPSRRYRIYGSTQSEVSDIWVHPQGVKLYDLCLMNFIFVEVCRKEKIIQRKYGTGDYEEIR
jgi:hypothetical protein